MRKERDRGKIASYADCIDDDYSVVDGDDSVCDTDDGLTPEEIDAFNKECEVDKAFRAGLRDVFGFFHMHIWTNPLNRIV